MAWMRRNSISYEEERMVGGVAALSGVAAALADAAPTGNAVVDAVFVAGFAAFVTWSGASAPWWALLVGAGLASVGALSGPVVLLLVAVAAIGGAGWIGWNWANHPIVRTLIAAAVVHVVLRLEWDPFFLSSVLLATVATGTIAVNGVLRRRRYLRKRVYVGGAVLAGFAVLATAGMVIAGIRAGAAARDGYAGMLDGLEFVKAGQVPEAAVALRQAALDLESASDGFGGSLTQLARIVPGAAQNRSASTEVLARAADAASSAADTLDVVNLDQLTVEDGVIDVFAFSSLAAPLEQLHATVAELRDALHDAESPWLVAPIQSRLAEAIEAADRLGPQSRATAAAARVAPAMLGAEGARRYFVAFVNNAEARGHSGLMGNWNEITIDNGRLEVTASGRTADLQLTPLLDLSLDASDEYLERYGSYGADINGGVDLKYWSNVTIPPDMPSVGNAMAQMYETVSGRRVDGVIVVDPAGIAGLLAVTGAIQLDDIDRRIDASNAERFLRLDQYEFAENEREDLLAVVTEQTIDNVLDGSLPPPHRMAPLLAPAVLNGHISVWAVRPEEQELMQLVGMDASLPVVSEPGTDAFAVSNTNASGNKIESFLERTITYHAEVDEPSGEVRASLRVEFTNTAPTRGYAEYVIGNLIDEPVGSNRMLVDVHTALTVQAARLDDEEIGIVTLPELGYNVWNSVFTVPADETVVLELDLAGNVGSGPYRLVYRPQPLPNRDALAFSARRSGGGTVFDYVGRLERRSVLSADGVEAWRPSDDEVD